MFIVYVNWYYTSTCAHFYENIFAFNIFTEYRFIFFIIWKSIHEFLYSSKVLVLVIAFAVYLCMQAWHSTILPLCIKNVFPFSFCLRYIPKLHDTLNTISLLQIFGYCYSICHGVHWRFKEYLMDCIWEISKVGTFLTQHFLGNYDIKSCPE